MDAPISRAEHEEFRKTIEKEFQRIEDEDKRQNKRIEILDESIKQIGELTVSVEKLALSIQNMAQEQARQGEHLEELEGRDGEMWRKVTGYIATAVISIIIGFVFAQIGM